VLSSIKRFGRLEGVKSGRKNFFLDQWIGIDEKT